MPQKRSTYGDITVTATETDRHETQSKSPAEGKEQQTDAIITATETQPTEKEDTPGANTPLPTTPVQCSTSYGTRPTQPEDELQPPIRATVSAEVTPKKRDSKPQKSKLKTIAKKKPKNHKVQFEPSADLHRSNRIEDAKRTEKLGEVECFYFSQVV